MGGTTRKKQIVAYVPAVIAAGARNRAKSRGQSLSDYIFRLIDQDLDGSMDYMMVQAGYQMTRANALLSVLAAKHLTADEMDNLKTKSREAARRAYGPVPLRPFDIETRLVGDGRFEEPPGDDWLDRF